MAVTISVTDTFIPFVTSIQLSAFKTQNACCNAVKHCEEIKNLVPWNGKFRQQQNTKIVPGEAGCCVRMEQAYGDPVNS